MSWEATQGLQLSLESPARSSKLQPRNRCIPPIPRGGRARHRPRSCGHSRGSDAAAGRPEGGRTGTRTWGCPELHLPQLLSEPLPLIALSLHLLTFILLRRSSLLPTFIIHFVLISFFKKSLILFFPMLIWTHFKICIPSYSCQLKG